MSKTRRYLDYLLIVSLAATLASCSSDKYDPAGIILEDHEGQEPPSWAILAPLSYVIASISPDIQVPVMICDTLDHVTAYANRDSQDGCEEQELWRKPITVKQLVSLGDERYVLSLDRIGWAGAADVAPVVPSGTVLQPDPSISSSSDDEYSNTLFTGPEETDGGLEIPDYTLLRVLDELPGHLNYLKVEVLSGPLKGRVRYANGIYETQSGFGTDSFARVKS